MAEVVGFESFFLAGSQTSAFVLGLPDVGIMGRDPGRAEHRKHPLAFIPQGQ